MALLVSCVADVRAAGFRIVNVDVTIVVQSPKLAAFLLSMRENVASHLEIPLGAVSVKAKTSDGMGYTGDGSGIAVYAVALLAEARS